MTTESTFRGWPMFYDKKQDKWLFSDTLEPVATTHKERPCGKCLKHTGPDGADPCLKHLPGVMNACCGHGEPKFSYIQFNNGVTIRGFNRIEGAE